MEAWLEPLCLLGDGSGSSKVGPRRSLRRKIAAAVLKFVVLFMLISFSMVEAGEDNSCFRFYGTHPAEPKLLGHSGDKISSA